MSANSKATTGNMHSVATSLIKAVLVACWVIMAFFIGGLLTLALEFVLSLAGLSMSSLSDPVEATVRAALMYGLATIVAVSVPLFLRREKKDGTSILGINRLPEWSDIMLGPAAFIPYFILSFSLVWITTVVFSGFDVDEIQEIGFQTITTSVGYSLAFLTLVVIAPFAEEVLFRGYLYGKLKGYIGTIGAILLTSFCFAALHLQLNVAVDVFALSIILCLLREFTGSIWAGVLLHMTKNFIAFYFLFITPLMA